MFCHEGPWHKVDRIWTIRTDGTRLRKIHTRTMAMEIFGDEFRSADVVSPATQRMVDPLQVVFCSNMFGPTYVFAVEVAKAAGN